MGLAGYTAQASRSRDLAAQCRGPETSTSLSEGTALLVIMGCGLAIRLYLSLTSYCISGDGIAYLSMARYFAEGDWRAALGAVYSPLYPALIPLMHRWVTGWEMAGNLVSTLFGTAAVATTYLMTREAFGRRDLCLGAAALMAIHPETAAYSASVRTEAGYLFFTTGACWLLLKALRERRATIAASAGVAGGLAYLYRTEAIGFLPLGIFFFAAAGALWRQATRRWLFTAASIFVVAFVIVAAPYIAYLRCATGHWTIGRELTAAMMYGMGDIARNPGEWRRLGWSETASPLMAIFDAPELYLQKVGRYFVESSYSFVQALDPTLAVMLAVGIWTRRHRILGSPGESFLATIAIFYFCGFALSYTGTRFMVHLIPFVFGWVAAGIIVMSRVAAQWWPRGRRIVQAIVPAAIVVALLPRTLWPIGYDMRGVRYAGEDIARMRKGSVAVAARDGRIAYYAGARLIQLPPSPPADLCGWLRSNGGDFLMIGNHDERLLNVASSQHCLELHKRYPRYGRGYYDLYSVKPPEEAPRPNSSSAKIETPR
jgi:Dolichyl-phosphate-mannose-protein mannosyltransferase